MKELCAVLVVYSSEAARMLSDERNVKDKITNNNRQSSLGSSLMNRTQYPQVSDEQKVVTDEYSIRVRAEKTGGSDSSNARPVSPGTLALMCDERNLFNSSASNGLADNGADAYGRLPNGQAIAETNAKQEKTVLTTFRDCLNKLIALGELKEMQCSSLARSDFGAQSQMGAVESSSTNAWWDLFSNEFSRSAVLPMTHASNNDNHIHLKIHDSC